MGALSQQEGFEGLRFARATILSSAPHMEPTSINVNAGNQFDTKVAGWASVEATAADAGSALAATPSAAAVFAAANTPANLDLILDIELPLTVRFGETEMTLAALTRLAPGSIIDLGRSRTIQWTYLSTAGWWPAPMSWWLPAITACESWK